MGGLNSASFAAIGAVLALILAGAPSARGQEGGPSEPPAAGTVRTTGGTLGKSIRANESGADAGSPAPSPAAAQPVEDIDSGGDSIRVYGGAPGAESSPGAEAAINPPVATAPAPAAEASPSTQTAGAPAAAPTAAPVESASTAPEAAPAAPPVESAGTEPVAAPAADTNPAPAEATGSSHKNAAAASGSTKVASLSPSSKDEDSGGALQFSSQHGPINIKSDTMSLDYKANSVLFSGHVRAIQEPGQLTSDRLRVNYGQGFKDVKEMFADGNVRISQRDQWATSDHAVMDQTKRTVVLTGSPVVHQGTDQITGDRITVYMDTNKSVVEHARAIIFPHESKTADNKTPPVAAPDKPQ